VADDARVMVVVAHDSSSTNLSNRMSCGLPIQRCHSTHKGLSALGLDRANIRLVGNSPHPTGNDAQASFLLLCNGVTRPIRLPFGNRAFGLLRCHLETCLKFFNSLQVLSIISSIVPVGSLASSSAREREPCVPALGPVLGREFFVSFHVDISLHLPNRKQEANLWANACDPRAKAAERWRSPEIVG